MARRDLSSFWLYRYRFLIGYGIIGILLAALLVFAGLYVPGGLSVFEKDAVVQTAALDWTNPTSLLIVNLPYHAFQAGIFELFGISDFTIKLPALILGLVSALGLIVLLRRWFPTSIAILASLIAVTTGQFLLVAQSGGGGILYIFWPVILLLLGTQITRVKKYRFLWKILFSIAAALSLYTPLSIYALLAIAFTIVLHPHLRIAIKRLSKVRLSFCLLLGLLLIAPLVWMIIRDPNAGLTLLGLPSTWPDLWANAQLIATQYFLFWAPSATSVLTPVFGLGSALLIGLGLYRLVRTRETTRSYLIISWIVCLIPILIISPTYITIVFLPAVLLLAAGLTSLIGYWYRLFPLNPYARVAGLLPIVVLVVVLIGSGIDRYIFGYHYSPTVATNYSKDLALLPVATDTLVVTTEERDFYQAVANFRDGLSVVTTAPASGAYTTTREARPTDTDDVRISSIITSPFAEQSDRFYVYEPRPADDY
jgi:4-amino-4-deoxy-L-arabinose transferase-like glycosyltransferase